MPAGRPGRGFLILVIQREKNIKTSQKNAAKKFSFFKLFCILNVRIKEPVKNAVIPHDDRMKKK